MYQYYGIPYKTPTEGLYFIAKDFLKLVERPEYYFKHEVSLINPQESTLAKKGKDIHYPVGLIDDVEVYFMHYPDPIEAVNKWHRRASRMNFKKLFFLLTETELSDKEDIVYFSELMKRRPRGEFVWFKRIWIFRMFNMCLMSRKMKIMEMPPGTLKLLLIL